LRNKTLVNFPATTEEYWYMAGEQMLSVTLSSGVNLIIEATTEPTFADYLSRARWVDINGLAVPCMHPDDDTRLDRIPLIVGRQQ
jgi:hypothetical protein